MRTSIAVITSLTFVVTCDSARVPTSPSPSPQSSPSPAPGPAPAPAPVAPAAIAFRVSGIVSNEEGMPLDGAIVVLTYQSAVAPTQTVNASTGLDGRYELRLDAQQPGNVNALIRATRGAEYAPSEQFVRVVDNAEKNLRLRPIRTITVGQPGVLTFDSESSRCSSLGIAGICEWIRVRYPSTFTSMLTVRATTETGGVIATIRASVPDPIFSVNAPHVPPPTLVVGQGSVTFQAGDEEWYANYYPRTADVVVTIPAEAVPQRVEVDVR